MVRHVFTALVVLFACTPFTPEANDHPCSPEADHGTTAPFAQMQFDALDADFFAAPFPALGRSVGDKLDSERFPACTSLMWHLRDLLPREGASISSAIFFGLDGQVLPGTNLPPSYLRPELRRSTPDGTMTLEPPSALLFPVSDPFELVPINVAVSESDVCAPDGRSQGPRVLLSMLPIQGQPLDVNTLYAAVVTTKIAQRSQKMIDLCAGALPHPLYRDGLDAAATIGLPCDRIAAISVFRTGDPTEDMRKVTTLARDDLRIHRSCPAVRLTREKKADNPSANRCQSSSFCVYSGEVLLPQYQEGTPPYFPYVDWGGGWPRASIPSRDPTVTGCDQPSPSPEQHAGWEPAWRAARIVVTIPKHSPPKTGFPVVDLARTGGGTKTDTLVDRGPRLNPSWCGDGVPCAGPAEVFESVGFAGVSIDGPLVGQSRTEPIEIDEDLGIFDFLNPIALQDNIRQSAVELALAPDILANVEIDLAECEEAADSRIVGGTNPDKLFDFDHLAMFSHSMGSTISPLALVNQPRFGAAILSGAGGSLIENALYKTQPVPVNAAACLLGYTCSSPQARDVPMSMLQWALEKADTQSYVRSMVRDPDGPGRHVLMIQGLVDNYILPPIADVVILGARLDLGLGPSCNGDPRCDHQPVRGVVASPGYPSIADLLPLSQGKVTSLSGGNVRWKEKDFTALVVQHRIDENREFAACTNVDGHEVIYESTLARHQYACFLRDFAAGIPPAVRTSGGALGECGP